MTERASRAENYLDEAGLQELSDAQMEDVSQRYAARLTANIDHGLSDGLQMVDTLIDRQDASQLPGNKYAWVLEMGGSNFYGAEVVTSDTGTPSIVHDHAQQPRHRKVELTTRRFASASSYFSEMADSLDPLFREASQPDAVGIVFSFPATPTKTSQGVDVMSPEQLQKQFVIPDISLQPIGQAMTQELEERYGISIETVAVLNDTPAVLLSVPDSRLGGVVGTGANIAAVIDEKLYNTTTGGSFNDVPTYPLFDAMDRNSSSPGRYLAAKQMGGIYLGMQFWEAVQLLSGQDVLPRSVADEVPSAAIADILDDNFDTIQTVFPEALNPEAQAALAQIALRLRNRSAQLMGTLLGTIIKTFPSNFRSYETIPMEGSVFWKTPEYEDLTAKAMERTMPRGNTIEFRRIASAGTLGAGAAALGLIR